MPVNKTNLVVAQYRIVLLCTSKAIKVMKKQLNEINEKAMKTFKNNFENKIAALKEEIRIRIKPRICL